MQLVSEVLLTHSCNISSFPPDTKFVPSFRHLEFTSQFWSTFVFFVILLPYSILKSTIIDSVCISWEPFTSQSRQCLLKPPFFSLLRAQHSSLPQVGCFHVFHGLGIISGFLLLSNTEFINYYIHFQLCWLFVRTLDSTIFMLKFLYSMYFLRRRT